MGALQRMTGLLLLFLEGKDIKLGFGLAVYLLDTYGLMERCEDKTHGSRRAEVCRAASTDDVE